jgi:nucleotide-binding universal stress UspA family protein
MKVLLAVDGSDCSLRAARTLAAWAKTCTGTCAHVLNAQPIVPYMDLLGEARRDRIDAWIQERGRQRSWAALRRTRSSSAATLVLAPGSDESIDQTLVAWQYQ